MIVNTRNGTRRIRLTKTEVNWLRRASCVLTDLSSVETGEQREHLERLSQAVADEAERYEGKTTGRETLNSGEKNA